MQIAHLNAFEVNEKAAPAELPPRIVTRTRFHVTIPQELYEELQKLLLQQFEAYGGEEDPSRINCKIRECLDIIRGCIDRDKPFLPHFD
jgi:hypothetical protein